MFVLHSSSRLMFLMEFVEVFLFLCVGREADAL